MKYAGKILFSECFGNKNDLLKIPIYLRNRDIKTIFLLHLLEMEKIEDVNTLFPLLATSHSKQGNGGNQDLERSIIFY